MSRPTPTVGDLIIYNSAGMARCSLGLLLEIYNKTDTGKVEGYETYYRILWAVPPSIPPRKEWSSPKDGDWSNGWHTHETQNNHRVEGWYRQGGWFMVYREKK